MSNNDILLKWMWFLEELKDKWSITDDCMQMMYLSLLEYDFSKLKEIDDKGEMKYWLVRFVGNNWFSKTSRYYYEYNKYYEVFEELPREIRY